MTLRTRFEEVEASTGISSATDDTLTRAVGRAIRQHLGPVEGPVLGSGVDAVLSSVIDISKNGFNESERLFGGDFASVERELALREFFRRVIPGLNEQLGLGFTIKEEEKK